MKRNKGTKVRRNAVPLWTYPEAQKALPYLASILRSARDHQIEANRWDLRARRLAAAPGRPDRSMLIAQEEALRESRLARERLQDTLEEFERLGIECAHPINGQALLPFVNEQQVAWFIYDLFDDQPLRFWRYQGDPEETRRSIQDIQQWRAVA
jgi:hypothetical protein